MKQKLVLAEINDRGEAVRIFRTVKASFLLPVESVAEFTKALAVGQIRRQVFARAGCTPHQAGNCEWCGSSIFWSSGSYNSGEMHEVVPKGRGGEVSIANSVAICRNCHTVSPDSAHGNRRWHSSKINSTKET